MSMTKDGAGYREHMDELFIDEAQYFLDTRDEEYREYCYLKSKQTSQEGHKPQSNERLENEQRKA